MDDAEVRICLGFDDLSAVGVLGGYGTFGLVGLISHLGVDLTELDPRSDDLELLGI